MSERSPSSETPPLEKIHPPTERIPPPSPHGAPPPGVTDLPAARRFGKYSLVTRIGRGGMGDVWKAWDGELSRWVAVKVLRNEFADDVPRFRQEASILGSLAHPNLVPVYEIGTHEGQIFFVMHLLTGKLLRDYQGKSRDRIVPLVRDAAAAVGFAHRQGFVHRDIKSTNIMVEERTMGDSAAPSDHVYVMDFGVARRSGPRSDMTVEGMTVGTPAFMSPEQARGGSVDPRADVYSFGATMYDLFFGRPPIEGATAMETLQLIQDRHPIAPRWIDPAFPEELERIMLKCLEKVPEKRYPNALALAEDLTRFIEGRKVFASAPTPERQSRPRLLLLAAAVGLLLLSVAGTIWAVSSARAARLRARADALWTRLQPLLSRAEVASRLGEHQSARDLWLESLRACEEELSRGPLAEAHVLAARCHRLRGERVPAIEEVERALAIDFDLADARLERALLTLEELRTRFDESRILASGMRRPPGPPRPFTPGEIERAFPRLVELGQSVSRDLRESQKGLRFASPREARWAGSELSRIRGAFPVEDLEGILAEDQLFWPAHLSIGRIQAARGALDDAVQSAGRVLELHRGRPEALLFRAGCRLWQGEASPDAGEKARLCGLAREDADLAIKEGGDTAEAWTIRAHARLRLGESNGAIEDYGEALKRDAASLWARFGRAMSLFAADDLPAAQFDFDEFLARCPEHSRAWLGRGSVRYAAGNFRGAIEDFTRSVGIDPEYPEAWGNRGWARLRVDDREGAASDFRKFLFLAPPGTPNRESIEEELKKLERPS